MPEILNCNDDAMELLKKLKRILKHYHASIDIETSPRSEDGVSGISIRMGSDKIFITDNWSLDESDLPK